MRFIALLNMPETNTGNPAADLATLRSQTARALHRLAERVANGEAPIPVSPATEGQPGTCYAESQFINVRVADDDPEPIGSATFARPTYYVAELQHPGYIRDYGRRRR
jgi:hypothetical protein